jgi:O-glycosyl hydrolase
MKSNNSTRNGGYLLPEMYDDFVDYLIEYIDSCTAISGVELYAVSLQNELEWAQPFNSCVYEPNQIRDLIKVAKPRFEAAGLQTKIFFPEHMADLGRNERYIDAVLNDPVAREAADIVAVHGYLLDGASPDSPDAQNWQTLFGKGDAYGMPLWMTETSGYHWWDWADGMSLAKGMYTAFKHGQISAWVWWALDDPHKSNQEDERYTLWYDGEPTRLFDVHRNYSRYIRPGAVQIDAQSSEPGLLALAFYHPQSDYTTVVLTNQSSSSQTVSLSGPDLPVVMDSYTTNASAGMAPQQDQSITAIVLPPQSITTLTNDREELSSISGLRGSIDNKRLQQPGLTRQGTVLYSYNTPHAAQLMIYDLNGRAVAPREAKGTLPGRGIFIARQQSVSRAQNHIIVMP